MVSFQSKSRRALFQVLTLYSNGGDRLLLSELILQLVQPGVDALPGQQLPVGSLFADLAPLDHEDPVGEHDVQEYGVKGMGSGRELRHPSSQSRTIHYYKT